MDSEVPFAVGNIYIEVCIVLYKRRAKNIKWRCVHA